MAKKCYKSECDNIAKKEVGYLEKKTPEYLDSKTKNAGNNNYTKYARDLNEKGKGRGLLNGNKQGQDWCAVFQIWIICEACDWDLDKVRKVLCLDGSADEGASAASVTYMKRYFKAKGRYDKNPKEGDLICFNTDKDSGLEHIGRVRKVTATMIYTTEGNTKKDGKGGVWEKSYKRNDPKIDGYCHPKYDKEDEPEPTPEPTPTPTPEPTPTPKPDKKVVKASHPAEKFNENLKGEYKATTGLNMRDGAGTKYKILTTLSKGDKVKCYGYYSIDNGVKWLYVTITKGNTIYEGFCKGTFLIK